MEAEYFCGKVPVGALLFCVGSLGTGGTDCKAGVHTGFAMTVLFFMEAVLRTVFAGVAGGGATGRKLLA